MHFFFPATNELRIALLSKTRIYNLGLKIAFRMKSRISNIANLYLHKYSLIDFKIEIKNQRVLKCD